MHEVNSFRKAITDRWYRIKAIFKKPVLKYLELHLTDHCNLNCRGCSHFSPLADKWFASIDEHDRDMARLSDLLSGIGQIRLMGGEPLLHPEVTLFLTSTRTHFPSSDIRIVTNGLLLAKMPEMFWRVCAEAKIGIDITVFPPTQKRVDEWCGLGRANNIPVSITQKEKFHKFLDFTGNADPVTSIQTCRRHFYCPYLRQGKLYNCSFPALCRYLNTHFGTNVPSDYTIDLYQEGITGWKIIADLDKPMNACSYCFNHISEFEWDESKKNREEWDTNAPAVLRHSPR